MIMDESSQVIVQRTLASKNMVHAKVQNERCTHSIVGTLFLSYFFSGRHRPHELPEVAPAVAHGISGNDVTSSLPQRGRLRGAGRMQKDLPVRVSSFGKARVSCNYRVKYQYACG